MNANSNRDAPFHSTLFAAALTLAACGAKRTRAARADPELDALFAQLRASRRTPRPPPRSSTRIWERWADSGSPTVNILLERAAAAERRATPNSPGASSIRPATSRPTTPSPGTAAPTSPTAPRIIAGAIAAIQETLKREPRHFGALAGLGLIYEELGQQRAALEAFRAALAIHPHYEAALQGVRRLEPRVDGRDA